MNRNRARDTDPMPVIDEVTHPGSAPTVEAMPKAAVALDTRTERILKAIDRPPRPPAPTPELRANSNGGDFVAYSSPARLPGGPPRSGEERRHQAFAELSALLHELPATDSQAPASTHTLAPRLRPRLPRWAWACVAVVGIAGGAAVWGSSMTPMTAKQPRERVAPSVSVAVLPTQTNPLPAHPAESVASDSLPSTRTLEGVFMVPVSSAARLPPPLHVPQQRAAGKELRASRATSAADSAADSAPDELIEHPW